MVKNTHGGSGHKSQARKNVVNTKFASTKTRLKNKEDDEIYAQILSILGGSMCAVVCDDDVERMCVIRGKFRGRGKRDNTLSRGTWVLVGMRTWSGTTKSGKEQCDLLEIYSDAEKKKLQTLDTSVSWSKFISNDNTFSAVQSKDAEVEFTDENNEEYAELMTHKNKKISLSTSEKDVSEEEVEISLEDI